MYNYLKSMFKARYLTTQLSRNSRRTTKNLTMMKKNFINNDEKKTLSETRIVTD